MTVSRAYRIILIFSIVIQLSLFFIVVAVSLWIDQIYNGDIAKLTTRSEVFRGIDMYVQLCPSVFSLTDFRCSTILIVVLPWLSMARLFIDLSLPTNSTDAIIGLDLGTT